MRGVRRDPGCASVGNFLRSPSRAPPVIDLFLTYESDVNMNKSLKARFVEGMAN